MSKVPLGNLSLAGCRVMIICCLCQGFGLHKTGDSVRAARAEDLQQGRSRAQGKGCCCKRCCEGWGSPQVPGWCHCSKTFCAAQRIAGKPALIPTEKGQALERVQTPS